MTDFDEYSTGGMDIGLETDTDSNISSASVQYVHLEAGGTGDDAEYSVDSHSSATLTPSHIDRGRNIIYRKFPPVYKLSHGKKRTVVLKQPIVVYTTSHSPGAYIRDAITGAVYKHMRVGTPAENLFFKAALATGELSAFSNHLYFSCPDDYTSHMKCDVSDDTRIRWTKKFDAEMKHIEHKKKATYTIV
jgi:hypothetical protein